VLFAGDNKNDVRAAVEEYSKWLRERLNSSKHRLNLIEKIKEEIKTLKDKAYKMREYELKEENAYEIGRLSQGIAIWENTGDIQAEQVYDKFKTNLKDKANSAESHAKKNGRNRIFLYRDDAEPIEIT
jgi:GGDEF domain-containing protein